MGRCLGVLILLTHAHVVLADWSELNRYQATISRRSFETLLKTVYCPSGALDKFLEYGSNSVTIYSNPTHTNALFILRFGADALVGHPSPQFRHIVLDPGHIGGDWSRFEERHFQRGSDAPVEEAALNLTVAGHLKRLLEAAGCMVSLTKTNFQPVTDQRPPVARSDIFARARLINEHLRPDLTICIHFNAIEWNETFDLVDDNRLAVFVHGNYLADELVSDDQKYHLLRKLLAGHHVTERNVAESVAKSLARSTGLLPLPVGPTASSLGANAYVQARNLAANRLYDGPVIYLEPYYMNNKLVYRRLQLGDYDGQREIDGRPYRSIFREYADAVTEGLRSYLAGH